MIKDKDSILFIGLAHIIIVKYSDIFNVKMVQYLFTAVIIFPRCLLLAERLINKQTFCTIIAYGILINIVESTFIYCSKLNFSNGVYL